MCFTMASPMPVPLRPTAAAAAPLETRLYRLSYAWAAAMAAILQKFLSPRGSILTDARTNTLIITDVPTVLEGIPAPPAETERR